MKKNVHEIKFEEKDAWSKQFNKCSDLYAKAFDESLSEEEQRKKFDEFVSERIRLEMGMYND